MTLVPLLRTSLSNTYRIYSKTHSFHWNVTGSRFQELHLFFETLYTQLWMEVDQIAELIRIEGETAPINGEDLVSHGSIEMATSVPSGDEMLKILTADLEVLITSLKEAEANASDSPSALDALSTIIAGHEKTLWMMKSMV